MYDLEKFSWKVRSINSILIFPVEIIFYFSVHVLLVSFFLEVCVQKFFNLLLDTWKNIYVYHIRFSSIRDVALLFSKVNRI